MSNYLIKLTPVGKSFFGGDMTFTVGAKERPKDKDWNKLREEEKAKIKKEISDNTRYSSYIIRSEMFPQQTSLLGMLRFLLLRNYKDHVLFDISNNSIKEGMKGEVEIVIGKSSFTAKEDGSVNDFGLIEKLSPCFLMNGDNIITRLPKDYGLESIDLSASNTLSYNDSPITLKMVLTKEKDNEGKNKQYSAKDGLSVRYGFVSKDEKGEDILSIYDENEIFVEDQRIGISRNIVTGKTEENALYKQINYRLADDFCFAFYAKLNINKEDIEPYNNKIVQLGADNSQFIIQIAPLKGEDANAENLPKISLPSSNVSVNNGYCKIVLASPTIMDKETAKLTDFAITDTIPFRYMETTIHCEKYDRLSGKITHSKKVELFQTGSVFYFRSKDNATEFIKEIEKHQEFHQIGYNLFQEIKFSNE